MLYCKSAACGVYLGSMGADSCSLCGHVDQDAIESATAEPLLARISDLERKLAYANEVIEQRNAELADARNQALEDAASECERTVASIPDADLLRRVVRHVAQRRPKRQEFAWSAVSEAFALGSTYSMQLLRRFGLDPDTGAEAKSPNTEAMRHAAKDER